MSAAAARRRKQLASKKGGADAVDLKMKELLAGADAEDVAYEALQLAQSQIRKLVNSGSYKESNELAYTSSLCLLEKKKVSVASQLLHLLADILRETQTAVSNDWLSKIGTLHKAHSAALKETKEGTEKSRLLRLEREFLRKCIVWSNDFGKVRFGSMQLLEMLGDLLWTLPPDGEEEDKVSLQQDAIQSLVLAEQPLKILAYLKELPAPTKAELASGHSCPPATRDALLTRSILAFCAIENLRDANILLRGYLDDKVDDRTVEDMTTSYMKKDDNLAPAHLIFCSMMLRICEKDARTGPLFQWLLRSFKKELESFPSSGNQIIQSYLTKIGKVYFNIQPPPSMMSMMENMMGMMGGGGAGMNPAMMQQMMAQAQGMQGGMR